MRKFNYYQFMPATIAWPPVQLNVLLLYDHLPMGFEGPGGAGAWLGVNQEIQDIQLLQLPLQLVQFHQSAQGQFSHLPTCNTHPQWPQIKMRPNPSMPMRYPHVGIFAETPTRMLPLTSYIFTFDPYVLRLILSNENDEKKTLLHSSGIFWKQDCWTISSLGHLYCGSTAGLHSREYGE